MPHTNGPSNDSSVTFEYPSELLLDALRHSTDGSIYLCNMKTGLYYFPDELVREFDLPGNIIRDIPKYWASRIHPDHQAPFYEAFYPLFRGESDEHYVDYQIRNRQGDWVWLRCRGHVVHDADGAPALFAGMIENLNKRGKLDPVTGLCSKFELERRLSEALSAHPGRPLGLMILDLDDFRHVNNLYDRQFGDEVLYETARMLQSMLKPGMQVFRLDSDEFGVLTLDSSDDEMAALFAGFQSCFSHQHEHNGRKYFCTISAGSVLYPRDGESWLELLKHATYSLDIAKSEGKNRLIRFSAKIMSDKERELYLTERLYESVENGFSGFELYYQPQVEADTGKLTGAEALCRWKCGAEGFIPPFQFIPLLEESGLIQLAGQWIFREAVRTSARWLGQGHELTISINLSYLQLNDPGFIDFMERTLEEEGASPDHIIVELTESCIASSATLHETFARIRALGLRIAMDDFGTGYSSLGILKDVPADIVKIDRVFVRDILRSRFDATFIRSIVDLCRDVGLQVCLEGVEQQAEYDAVRPMRLDFIQGYYFGKPMSVRQFEAHFWPENPCRHKIS